MSSVKTSFFEELLSKRAALIAEQAKQLADLENQIRAAARAEGYVWTPLGPSGGKVSPRHSSAKEAFHDRNREECIKKGTVKPDGSPDLERFRVEMKAKKLGVTMPGVLQMEIKERQKRAWEKFKDVGKSKR